MNKSKKHIKHNNIVDVYINGGFITWRLRGRVVIFSVIDNTFSTYLESENEK